MRQDGDDSGRHEGMEKKSAATGGEGIMCEHTRGCHLNNEIVNGFQRQIQHLTNRCCEERDVREGQRKQ